MVIRSSSIKKASQVEPQRLEGPETPRRGRSRKVADTPQEPPQSSTDASEGASVPAKRGRPRKQASPEASASAEAEIAAKLHQPAPKRRTRSKAASADEAEPVVAPKVRSRSTRAKAAQDSPAQEAPTESEAELALMAPEASVELAPEVPASMAGSLEPLPPLPLQEELEPALALPPLEAPEAHEAEAPGQDDRSSTETAPQGDREGLRPLPRRPRYPYVTLAAMTLVELRQIALEYGIPVYSARRKDELIYQILAAQAARIDQSFGGGTLEIMEEGYGFLRPEGLLPGDSDIYMSASQIRRFRLRNGDVVWGMIRKGREAGQNAALSWVETVNFSDPERLHGRPHFQSLVPVFPDRLLKLETDRNHMATRLMDLFSPLGRGQRALIVSPPKAGKTSLLKEIAAAVAQNHSDVILMVLLIDERPEEVTDIQRSVTGEVIASTFDRPPYEHIRVANLALEKAKRLVEMKKDVVLLLDSITRLTRASNLCEPPSGRTLSGGMDPAGLYFPKRLFGAARNIESGGSLTIVGTALTETGSRMDDVIYEEFKGTGNMEVHLSRRLAEQRLFPALDIMKSGTRREDLLLPQEDLQKIWALRRRLVSAEETEALSLILDRLRRSDSNAQFLESIKNA